MSYYADDRRVPAKSRSDIRRFANSIRDLFGIDHSQPFPVMEFLEFALPRVFPDFELEILSVEEMGEKHGETLHDRRIIRIREDIYDRACNGEGRDRFTVCHEMGHLFMHAHLDVSMARTRGKYPAYESSEWQANAFAGELLMPHDAIVGMDIWEVADRFLVSESAAEKQLRS